MRMSRGKRLKPTEMFGEDRCSVCGKRPDEVDSFVQQVLLHLQLLRGITVRNIAISPTTLPGRPMREECLELLFVLLREPDLS